MKLLIIGTGYVGLVSGACFAALGHDVICIDKDKNKISALNSGMIPIYEPGLEEIVKENRSKGRLKFSDNIDDAIDSAEIILLAVGTPTDEKTGRADLSYIFAAVEEIAQKISHKALLVTKSTVPVGTGKKIAHILAEKCPDADCEAASNPEFLREGSAVLDFMQPDRIIVGVESDFARDLLLKLYKPLIDRSFNIFCTNVATAELIKYASNAFLATKIAFANEISDICEGVGADVRDVIKGMGMDKRIGIGHMNPGPGFGGSCFPKDTLALTYIARDASAPSKIVESVIEANEQRKKNMAQKVVDSCGGVKGKIISILGLTFKANTDDMRYSPAIVIIDELIKAGAVIRTYDPVGMDEAKKVIKSDITWCGSMKEVLSGAEAAVIVTEWDEFSKTSPQFFKNNMQGDIIVDLRNILSPEQFRRDGLRYFCLGGK